MRMPPFSSLSPIAPMPSRVLMTADAVDGVWNYALELIAALRPRGIEVALAVMGPPPSPRQRGEAVAIGNLELHERPFAMEWMADPWADVARAGDWLLELEEDFAPDVIHLNSYCHGSLPWSAPVLMAAHSDLLSWWRAVHGCASPGPGRWDRYHAEVTAGLRGADLVVFSTQAMASSFAQIYHPNPLRFPARIIPNARDPARFPVLEKEEFVLSAGCAGDKAKNIAALDQAAAELPWPVFLAGATEGPDGEAEEFTYLDCLGPLSPCTLAQRMGHASIFALPARYEPMGLSALEAALAGCALVLGDLPSSREVWGDAALFVDPGNPNALAATLRLLIEDRTLRKEMGRRARRKTLARTPGRMAESYFDCYREILLRTPHTSNASELNALH